MTTLTSETGENATPPTPAATVILIKDGRQGLETLLLHRTPGRDPFAGAWVFPGGAVESADGPVPPGMSWPLSARRAAVRELREETGLRLAPETLVPFAQWTSPPTMPRRFHTWFFVAGAPKGSIRLNRQEVDAHRWVAPRRVMTDHRAQAMTLFPPTWVSLYELVGARSAGGVLEAYARRAPAVFAPRVGRWRDDLCFFYQEDAAYADLDAERCGPRHRLRVRADGWVYIRDGRRD